MAYYFHGTKPLKENIWAKDPWDILAVWNRLAASIWGTLIFHLMWQGSSRCDVSLELEHLSNMPPHVSGTVIDLWNIQRMGPLNSFGVQTPLRKTPHSKTIIQLRVFLRRSVHLRFWQGCRASGKETEMMKPNSGHSLSSPATTTCYNFYQHNSSPELKEASKLQRAKSKH